MKHFLFALAFLFASSANAGLILNIYEDASNDVVFDFSGSDTVTQGAANYARNGFWFGDITNDIYGGPTGAYNPHTDSFLAANTTQGTNSTLSDIYLNGGIGHELGIRLNNFSILTAANNGDLVTWSGQAVLNLDFSDFMAGTWTGNSLNAGGSDELILRNGYTITVGEQVARVSTPATIALFGLGLAGIGFSRKKKAAA